MADHAGLVHGAAGLTPAALHTGHFAATTLFRRTQAPSSSTSTSSPGLIGCVTPDVPVKITSPGFKVTCRLTKLTIFAVPWISSLVLQSCTVLPLRRVRRLRLS